MSFTPYPHQIAGLQELKEHDAWAHFWDMGTGKTWVQIQDQLRRKRAGEPTGGLVFTVNRNKSNWEKQVREYGEGTLTASVPEGSTSDRIAEIRAGAADLYVLNAESLVYLKDFLLSRNWPTVIVDESTVIKNPQAMRTRTALQLRARLRRIMTGLPNPNSPLDLYGQMTFIEPFLFGNWYRFKDRYAITGKQRGLSGVMANAILGYKNVDELYALIKPHCSIVGEEVLGLPPRVYMDVDVPLTGETLKHYENIQQDLRTWWGNGDELKARLAITKLLRLSQIAGGLLQEGDRKEWIPDNPKILALDDLLEQNILKPTDKVVVFAIFQEEIEQIAARYPQYKPRIIYGKASVQETDKAWQEFQEEGNDNQLMVAQSHTGGIGIDLYKARTAIYYTRDFSLEAYKQSQKRLHRLGQTGTVRILHLIAKLPRLKAKRHLSDPLDRKSIDEVNAEALRRKALVASGLMKTSFSAQEIRRIVDEALR